MRLVDRYRTDISNNAPLLTDSFLAPISRPPASGPTLENRAPHPVFDGPASASITAAAAIAIAMYATVYRNMVLPDDSPFPSTSIIQAYSQWPP